jgi:hypothetical protein
MDRNLPIKSEPSGRTFKAKMICLKWFAFKNNAQIKKNKQHRQLARQITNRKHQLPSQPPDLLFQI